MKTYVFDTHKIHVDFTEALLMSIHMLPWRRKRNVCVHCPAYLEQGMLCFSLQIKELRYDYTTCDNMNNPGQTCSAFLDNQPVNNTGQTCYCKVNLSLKEDFTVSYI